MRTASIWLVFAALVAFACGGTQRAEAPPDAAGVMDPKLGCTLHEGDDPAACAARGHGCVMAPPPWCSGLGVPPPPPDPHQACACVCDEDRILKCA